MKTFLSEKFDAYSIVKPGSDLTTSTQSVKEDINTLTNKDILLLGGGSSDLDKQNFKTVLKLIAEIIKPHNPTNIFTYWCSSLP